MRFVGNRYKIINNEEAFELNQFYEARDALDNKKVLIKVIEHNKHIHADFISNLIDEITDMQTMNCPYILNMIDVGVHCTEDSVLYYFVSEYSKGITLDKIIAGNYLHLEAIINMSTQILKALEAAQLNNFYYNGDLKPSNILVDENYNIKVCNFPVTKANKGVNIRSGDEISYLSPHQLNVNYTDYETDFFAVGLIIFESIFKKMPFGVGRTEKEMLSLIDKGINWREVVASNGNEKLINIIKKLLSRTNKYENIQDIIIDLSKVMYQKADIEDQEDEIEDDCIYETKDSSKSIKLIGKKVFMGAAVIAMVSLMVISTFLSSS